MTGPCNFVKKILEISITMFPVLRMCWQRTVLHEAFQKRTIFKYIILYWAIQVRHHPRCRYQTRTPILFIVDTISLPNIENVNFQNTGSQCPMKIRPIHVPPFYTSLVHQSTFTSTVVHSLCAPVSKSHLTLFQNPCTSVLRSHTSLFHNPCTVHEHKVSYMYRQQAKCRHINRLT